MQSLKVDIEAERRAKNDAVSSKLSIQEKSTAFIQQQQREIEKLHAEKVRESVKSVLTVMNGLAIISYVQSCVSIVSKCWCVC